MKPFSALICPICREMQLAYKGSGRPNLTCSPPCAAAYRGLRQSMDRNQQKTVKALELALEASQGLPWEFPSMIKNVLRTLNSASPPYLVSNHLRQKNQDWPGAPEEDSG
jgi:hypothetical protein